MRRRRRAGAATIATRRRRARSRSSPRFTACVRASECQDRRVKWIAILARSASTAAADHFVMKETESDNIHLANQEGAINRRADITITVDLSAGGKAKVIAAGTRSEHNLFQTFSTDED